MPSQNSPPFPRGETFSQFADDQNADTTQSPVQEGREYYFEDKDYAASGGVIGERTNSLVKCRIMRNSSGAAILPKRFIKNKTDGATPALTLGRTAGYATAITDLCCGVVDEFLPAAGVPDGDLFWSVVEGVTKVTTASAGDTNIPVGGAVIPSTTGLAIQGVETAGAALAADITAAIALALHAPAIALTAVNATATDFYVKVRPVAM